MSKPSKNRRKDIGPTLCGIVLPLDLSDKDFHEMGRAGGLCLNAEQRQALTRTLEHYVTLQKAINEKPERQAVRDKLEEWKRCAQTLYSGTFRDDAVTCAAMERLEHMQFDKDRAHLWNGSRINTLQDSLGSFMVACEKALADIDKETSQDKGGKAADVQRNRLLSVLDVIFEEARGQRGSKERFILKAVSKIPEDYRPKLPEGNGEILKLLKRSRPKSVKMKRA